MSDNSTIRILVLEDDPDMRELLAEVLESQGYEVVAVASGLEAVREAAEQTFALIVADIRMEGLNGLEALAQAKQHQPDVGSLIVSGYATDAETERAAELGVGAYLKKPFRMKRFLDAVRAQLTKVAQAERLEESTNLGEKAFLWALEAFLETVDEKGLYLLPGVLTGARRLAERLSAALDFDGATSKQVGLAAQLVSLESSGFTQPPDWILEREDFLVPFSRALTVPASLEAQVTRLTRLACSEGAPVDGPAAEEEGISEEVFDAYRSQNGPPEDESPENGSPFGPEASQRTAGLLSLARALAYAGDDTNAQAAFEKAQTLAGHPQARLTIQLETLKHKAQQGCEFGELEAEISTISQALNGLGPLSAAQAELELGLLLRQAGKEEEAAKRLHKSASGFQRLGQETLEGVARIALSAITSEQHDRLPETAALLLHPSGLDQLTSRAGWLVPALAESPVEDKLLVQLTHRVPGKLGRALREGKLSLSARQRLLGLISGLPAVPEEIVTAFQNDQDPSLRAKAESLNQKDRSSERPLLRIHSFGPFEAFLGERHIPASEWRTKKTAFLVARLAESWPKTI